MTDAEIALYAAVRVAIDPDWRISAEYRAMGTWTDVTFYFRRARFVDFVSPASGQISDRLGYEDAAMQFAYSEDTLIPAARVIGWQAKAVTGQYG